MRRNFPNGNSYLAMMASVSWNSPRGRFRNETIAEPLAKIMKKKLLSILLPLVFLITSLSFSQTKYGITLGINTSRFTDEFNTINGSYVNFSSTGLSVGIFSEISISEKISFYPKLIYNQIGDREKDYSNFLAANTVDYKLDYLSVPLNVKFFNKPYIIIGPQIGILLSEKAESLNFGKIKNSLDVGANIGIGHVFNQFRIEVSLYQGISSLLEIEEQFSNGIIDVRNTYLNLSFGYNFK